MSVSPRWCAAQVPYPEVRVERPDLYYARFLMKDNAGRVSELTAITQYVYHHVVLEERFPDTAKLLECISIVEMHHLELVSETIYRLGGRPVYGTRSGAGGFRWWRGDFVEYGKGICDMLAADIQGEYDAISQYRKHIRMINDAGIRILLQRIILDEEEHIRLLTAAREQHCRN